jgi:polyhydroxybutyrate depolymerase
MGMSNGGFMSYRLACELSDKISAIASVTGSMSTNQINTCNPINPIPIMQIHGTLDPTVLYNGSLGIEAIDDVISFWVNFNNCNTQPIFNNITDLNLIDLCTAEHYIYENGDNDTSVELYKIINGGHTWPGAAIPLAGNNTNQDFNASQVIWQFFNQYDINGLIETNSNIQEPEIKKKKLESIDILGRKTNKNKGFQLHIYDDGSIEKKYLIK